MGAEFVVSSLEEMCDLMCNNTIPKRKETKTMERCGRVVINNCGTKNEGWEVARAVDNKLWHWGLYSTQKKAEEVAMELGENAIVLRLEDGE